MPNGLKIVMLALSKEDKTNECLIAAFQSAQTKDDTPDPQITVVKSPDPDPVKPLIGSLQVRFTATSVLVQSILQNNKI